MTLFQTEKTDSWQHLADEDVWNAFRNGSKDALGFLYAEYIDDLFTYGLKIKGHKQLVKDCIHELFVELWYSRDRLTPVNRNIKFYLLKALKLKVNHHLRAEARFQDIPEKENTRTEWLVSPETQLIQSQMQEEQKTKLLQCLQQLTAHQQEILHLLFFEGLSYEEVSEIMSIDIRSVYTAAWRSIASLRKRLIDLLILLPVSIVLLQLP